jgi:hypothetical protein
MANRKGAQDFILKWINEISPGNETIKLYEIMFSKMNDKQFAAYMDDLEKGVKHLVIIEPNGRNSITVRRNLDLARKLGFEFHKRIWFEKTEGRPRFLSTQKYLILDLPIRRQSQLLTKKMKVPESNKVTDVLTGQPTGASKGAKISYPEVQVLAGLGLDSCVTELIKFRGGDNKGFYAYNALLARQGVVSLKTIEPYASGVESTKSLKAILMAMHIRSTL